jgi:hypothetical protein
MEVSVKWPAKKPVRYGKTKLCFALKNQAEKMWALGKSYLRKNNQDAADNCFKMAREHDKEADIVANKPNPTE